MSFKLSLDNRLPPVFMQEIPEGKAFEKLRLISDLNVHTVCQEARCPNLGACFKAGKLTFLILGNICTRNCRFCAVRKAGNKGLEIDLEEPMRIRDAVKKLGLNYVVITSVTRDDLRDGGSSIFARTLELIHSFKAEIKVEVLIPDFRGKISCLKTLLSAAPNVVAHNLETVRRLYSKVRPHADYRRSLGLLKRIKLLMPKVTTKSALMLGLGETQKEIICAMEDLRNSDCDCLVLGQYLSPSPRHYPVKEFISPKQFDSYRLTAFKMGFKSVLSSPLARSSYNAEQLYKYA